MCRPGRRFHRSVDRAGPETDHAAAAAARVQLDQAWADCLQDGAFSLDRLTGRLKPIDQAQLTELVDAVPAHAAVSGFLLRSSVVSGWPGLLVDGFESGPDGALRGVDTLRRDILAPDVLLCLFAGDIVRVQLHSRDP